MRHLSRLYESPIDLLIAADRRILLDIFFCIEYKDGYFYPQSVTQFLSNRKTKELMTKIIYAMLIELRMQEFT